MVNFYVFLKQINEKKFRFFWIFLLSLGKFFSILAADFGFLFFYYFQRKSWSLGDSSFICVLKKMKHLECMVESPGGE